MACCASADAQGVAIKSVVTDQSPLTLSKNFGPPLATAVDQAGNFFFVGRDGGALFSRPAGQAVVSLLQIGDQVVGIPGSQVSGFSPIIFASQAGVLFNVSFALSDGFQHSALLTCSSAGACKAIAKDQDAVPGGTAAFGNTFHAIGINDNGDVAFLTGQNGISQALFIVGPSTGALLTRIVGIGDSIPSDPNDPLFDISQESAINAHGQVLISGQTVNGSSLFVVSPTAIVSVAFVPIFGGTAVGGCTPDPIQSLGGFALNDSGAVAFVETTANSNAICYGTPGSTFNAAEVSGGPVPPPVNGTFGLFSNVPGGPIGGILNSFIFVPLVLDDSGNIFFSAPVVGGAAQNVFVRFDGTGHALTSVAYQGEPAPPPVTNKTISGVRSPSVAADGTLSFVASFAEGGSAIYQLSADGATTTLIAQQGGPAPAPANGALNLFLTTATQTLNNHAVVFHSGILAGAAYDAYLLASGGTLQSLVDTTDQLPSGVRVNLSSPSAGAGTFFSFRAARAGGAVSLFVSDLSTGSISRIIGEGDTSPVGGIVSGVGQSVVDKTGRVTFGLGISGGSPFGSLFAGTSSANLSKVIAAGDPAPGTSLTVAACTALSPVPNDSGQLVVTCSLAGGTGISAAQAIFRIGADGSLTKIVATGDIPAGGGTIGVLSIPFLNGSGQVAFEGLPAFGSSASPPGIYVGDGSSAAKPVVSAQPVIGLSNLFLVNGVVGVGDDGTVRFQAAEASTPALIGSASPPYSAWTTVASSGMAAPVAGGGTLSLTLNTCPSLLGGGFTACFSTSSLGNPAVQSNRENDFVFPALVTGNATTPSGYFISRGAGPQAGVLQPLYLQGQAAPGGGTFDAALSLSPEGNLTLAPDGEALFTDGVTTGGVPRLRMFVARADGSLVSVVSPGDTLQGGAINSISPLTQAAGTPGSFLVRVTAAGGSVNAAILALQTVSFNASPSPSALTITAGQTGQVLVTITPANGSTQTVSISCAGLPALASCQIAPPSVTLDGVHPATITITIQTTAHTTNTSSPAPRDYPSAPSSPRTLAPLVVGMAFLLLVPFFSRRRTSFAIAACLLLGFVSLTAGCGGGSTKSAGSPTLNPATGTPAGTYSSILMVTSAATSTAVPISVTIN